MSGVLSTNLRQRSVLDKILLYLKSNEVSDNRKSNGTLIEDIDDLRAPFGVSANIREYDDERLNTSNNLKLSLFFCVKSLIIS